MGDMSTEHPGLFSVRPPAGIDSMDECKATIESCIVRKVATVRRPYANDVSPSVLQKACRN